MEVSASPQAMVGIALGALGGAVIGYHLGGHKGLSRGEQEAAAGIFLGTVLGFLVAREYASERTGIIEGWIDRLTPAEADRQPGPGGSSS